ncbi:hypothetical protein [Sphingobium nicotianae]|uniref:Beta-barrel porin 2 n=1 Tax=Sphingobium nicotianae TaxID=2782607 RepID=A0A9X1IT46_9SPHN|nr:hypothetical protein [Sphingobium nicotianae]MBT2188952.1 hypothetical protein [Sphingobium nicotianae]
MTMVRHAGRALAVAVLLSSGAAFADAKVSAVASVNAGIASNPYGVTSGDAASGTLIGDFAPTVVIGTPRGDLSLSGRVAHTEYFKRYGGTTDYTLGARTEQRLSELTTINGAVGFNSSVRNGLYPVVDPSFPTNPNEPVVVDPSAGRGYAQRTETFNGSLGLNTSLSAYDTLSLSARGASLRYPDGAGSSLTYKTYGGSASYSRTIGPATSIGLSFDLGKIDYTTGANDSTQYSPAATFATRLADRVSLNLSAGVTISHFNQLTGSNSKTSFSGSVGLCYSGDLSRFCLNGSRRVGASSISGTSTVTSFGATYSLQLDPRSNIAANLSYARSRALAGFTGENSDYGYGSLSYNRTILERLSAVVTVSYSDSKNQFIDPRGNFSGTVGLRYRLGEL